MMVKRTSKPFDEYYKHKEEQTTGSAAEMQSKPSDTQPSDNGNDKVKTKTKNKDKKKTTKKEKEVIAKDSKKSGKKKRTEADGDVNDSRRISKSSNMPKKKGSSKKKKATKVDEQQLSSDDTLDNDEQDNDESKRKSVSKRKSKLKKSVKSKQKQESSDKQKSMGCVSSFKNELGTSDDDGSFSKGISPGLSPGLSPKATIKRRRDRQSIIETKLIEETAALEELLIDKSNHVQQEVDDAEEDMQIMQEWMSNETTVLEQCNVQLQAQLDDAKEDLKDLQEMMSKFSSARRIKREKSKSSLKKENGNASS